MAGLVRWLALGTLLFTGTAGGAEKEARSEQILGWIENALITPERIELKAKLDTGAKTTSLHALNIERFKRDGRRMVRFDIEDPEAGRMLTLERPLVRSVRIKESVSDEPSRRPVVELWLCVGDSGRHLEVNLVDRSRFNYPLLIGRNALAGSILVDSHNTFTQAPTCDAPEEAP